MSTTGSFWTHSYENLSLCLRRCFPLKNILLIANTLGLLLHNVKNHVQNYILVPRCHIHEQQKNNIMKKEFHSSCYCAKMAALQPNTPTAPSTKEPISVQQQPTVRITIDKDNDDDKWSWTDNNWLWITLWFYYFYLPRRICSIYWEHTVTWWHMDLHLFQRYVEPQKQSRSVCLLQPRYSFILPMHLCVEMGSSASLLGSSIIKIWMPKRMKADTRSKYSRTLQALWRLEN